MPGLDSVVGDHERILVRQNKEWGEILIGFESKNKFEIDDDQGNPIGLGKRPQEALFANSISALTFRRLNS